MNRSEEINELATALAKAQLEMDTAEKSAFNPQFKRPGEPQGSKYATLADVIKAAKVLAKHGLSFVQPARIAEDGGVTVETVLFHSSGQWLSDALTMRPQQNTPQGIGSALTYGRRYGLSSMIGIAADEDDDGNEASAKPPQRANGNGHGQSKPPPVAAAATSIWQKIQAMADDYGYPRGEKDADLIALTKAATKNKHGKDLTEADFIAVEIAMASAMVGTRKPEDDVRF